MMSQKFSVFDCHPVTRYITAGKRPKNGDRNYLPFSVTRPLMGAFSQVNAPAGVGLVLRRAKLSPCHPSACREGAGAAGAVALRLHLAWPRQRPIAIGAGV